MIEQEDKIIRTDESYEEIKPAGEKYSEEELENHVGGEIELRLLKDGYIVVFDGAGREKGKSHNILATQLLQYCSDTPEDVYGDAMLIGGERY